MPASPIVLSCTTGRLTFTRDDEGVGGWCQVALEAGDGHRALGANRWQDIAASLAAFLANPAAERTWVLSLAELHTSAYGHRDGANVVIELQDGDARWFSKLVLSAAERDTWLRALAGA